MPLLFLVWKFVFMIVKWKLSWFWGWISYNSPSLVILACRSSVWHFVNLSTTWLRPNVSQIVMIFCIHVSYFWAKQCMFTVFFPFFILNILKNGGCNVSLSTYKLCPKASLWLNRTLNLKTNIFYWVGRKLDLPQDCSFELFCI